MRQCEQHQVLQVSRNGWDHRHQAKPAWVRAGMTSRCRHGSSMTYPDSGYSSGCAQCLHAGVAGVVILGRKQCLQVGCRIPPLLLKFVPTMDGTSIPKDQRVCVQACCLSQNGRCYSRAPQHHGPGEGRKTVGTNTHTLAVLRHGICDRLVLRCAVVLW